MVEVAGVNLLNRLPVPQPARFWQIE